MTKYGPHLSAGGWFISRMYRHSPSNLIIKGLRHHTHTAGKIVPRWFVQMGYVGDHTVGFLPELGVCCCCC